jgi:nitric oxide reductase subunit B
MRSSFWAFNIGLSMMALFTLLPMGMLQLNAALEHGYWYARSADFMGKPIFDLLIWLRVPGDTIFSVGALRLGLSCACGSRQAQARATKSYKFRYR